VAYHSETLFDTVQKYPTYEKKDVFHCVVLPTMEALHFWKGNGHPHRPPTLVVHTHTREVEEQSPSEVLHIRAIVSFEH
jgi:hypothetical protein